MRILYKLIIVVILIELIFNMCSCVGTNGSTKQAPKMEYYIGDKWEYEYSSQLTGNITTEVTSMETINVKGKNYDVYVLTGHGSMEMEILDKTVTTNISALSYHNKDNGTLLKSESISTTISPLNNITTLSYTNITYNLPTSEYQFPMKVGDKRSYNVDFIIETVTITNGNASEPNIQEVTGTGDVEVLEMMTITVPAGSFETFKIRIDTISKINGGTEDIEGSMIMYYSPKAGTSVKIIIHTSTTPSTTEVEDLIMELKSYTYSGQTEFIIVNGTNEKEEDGGFIPGFGIILFLMVIALVGLVSRKRFIT